MKRGLIYILLLLLSMGCEDDRRYIYDNISIVANVNIVWPVGFERPNGATVMFFPREGSNSTIPTVKLTNNTQTSVKLLRGVYDAIVFNETSNSHSYLHFDGVHNYKSAAARWDLIPLADIFERTDIDQVIESTDETMLVDRIENIVVTQDMINNYATEEYYFYPKNTLYSVTVKAHVKGMNYASIITNSSKAYMKGVAHGLMMGSGDVSEEDAVICETINNKDYDAGSFDEGVMTSFFNIFGFVAPSKSAVAHELLISFRLRNGTFHTDVVRNVDDIMVVDEEKRTIFIEVGKGTADDPLIELPEVENTDNPDTNSGFTADVEGWGEQVDIFVDMD